MTLFRENCLTILEFCKGQIIFLKNLCGERNVIIKNVNTIEFKIFLKITLRYQIYNE